MQHRRIVPQDRDFTQIGIKSSLRVRLTTAMYALCTLVRSNQSTVTFAAAGPFCPFSMVKDTSWPSSNVLKPSFWTDQSRQLSFLTISCHSYRASSYCDCAEVHKDILATIFWRYEAEPFFGIEPFDNPSHLVAHAAVGNLVVGLVVVLVVSSDRELSILELDEAID
jgi:hypothetical protein